MGEKRWLIIISLIIILFSSFRIMNKNVSSNVLVDKTNYIMGTIIKLSLDEDVGDDIFEGAFDVIRDIEKNMSLNIVDSELNRLNERGFSEPTKVSDEMKFIINKSIDYSKLSSGYFDITVGPLVKLWGIGTEDAKVPSSDAIKNSLRTINYENIEVYRDNIKLNKDNMILDLGGIAKGYAADEVVKYLKSQNIKRAIVDLGGNIYALGSKEDGTPWSIGIQNPFNEARGDFLGVLSVSDKSVVTSGVYERYLEENNKRYHHILDPFTGYPVDNELMSVTIVSNESIDGDALSTAVFALGMNAGYELVKSLEDVEAIFVTKDSEVYLTPKLKYNFEINNKNFKVKQL